MVVLGTKGFVNTALMSVGIIGQPLEIMFSETAVIIGIIAVNLPFMVLSLQSVIEGIDRSIEEAAFSLGAAPATMFRRVLWPLALPGILAGTILTFILAMNAYATPFLLGGPLFKMMAPLVYNQFTQQTNWPFGGAIAFILMAVTLLLTIAANLVVQRATAAEFPETAKEAGMSFASFLANPKGYLKTHEMQLNGAGAARCRLP